MILDFLQKELRVGMLSSYDFVLYGRPTMSHIKAASVAVALNTSPWTGR